MNIVFSWQEIARECILVYVEYIVDPGSLNGQCWLVRHVDVVFLTVGHLFVFVLVAGSQPVGFTRVVWFWRLFVFLRRL